MYIYCIHVRLTISHVNDTIYYGGEYVHTYKADVLERISKAGRCIQHVRFVYF